MGGRSMRVEPDSGAEATAGSWFMVGNRMWWAGAYVLFCLYGLGAGVVFGRANTPDAAAVVPPESQAFPTVPSQPTTTVRTELPAGERETIRPIHCDAAVRRLNDLSESDRARLSSANIIEAGPEDEPDAMVIHVNDPEGPPSGTYVLGDTGGLRSAPRGTPSLAQSEVFVGGVGQRSPSESWECASGWDGTTDAFAGFLMRAARQSPDTVRAHLSDAAALRRLDRQTP
ncbi:MAG: hypothetical protein ACOYOQ_16240, partial [Microthrixaceae bacterium]